MEGNLDVSEPKFKDRKEVEVSGKPWSKGGSRHGGKECEALPPAREKPAWWGFPPHIVRRPLPPLPSFLDS